MGEVAVPFAQQPGHDVRTRVRQVVPLSRIDPEMEQRRRPLSLENTTSVRSAIPARFSASSSRPTLASISSMTSSYRSPRLRPANSCERNVPVFGTRIEDTGPPLLGGQYGRHVVRVRQAEVQVEALRLRQILRPAGMSKLVTPAAAYGAALFTTSLTLKSEPETTSAIADCSSTSTTRTTPTRELMRRITLPLWGSLISLVTRSTTS